ncbi:MAG: hypothetical protein ACRDBP_09520, partial [Luteolibacter sp.]
GESGVSHGLVMFDLALARGAAAAFAGEIVRTLSTLQYAAVDSGLSDAERAAVLDAGVCLILPRNPSLADLTPLSPSA